MARNGARSGCAASTSALGSVSIKSENGVVNRSGRGLRVTTTSRSAGTTPSMEASPPPAEGHTLSVRVTSGVGGVSVAIGDTGHGISAEHAERLFEPDFTLKAGGTGLGLAVVRQAVAAHGGSVTAQQQPGGGALFTVTLPLIAGGMDE